jgi:NAD+ kinase
MGVLAHPTRPLTRRVAETIAAALEAKGLEVWQFSQWDESTVRDHITDTDMVVAIGGDGAMLRAARVCAPYGVPVLGVNMGHLGFLTEIQRPDDWDSAMKTVLAGHYWIEQRMMIRVTAQRGEELLTQTDALNDVVISRGAVTRMIRLDTYIDGDWTTTYNADALIISTATGSTAYALACGGPILPPELRNILVVPVAPHLSLERPIVLPEGAMIEVIVSPDTQAEVVLSTDGVAMNGSLCSCDRVHVQASEHVSRFVRLRERNYFYRSLLDRLEPRTPAPPAPPQRQL